MAAGVIAGVSIVAVAFMAVFLVKVCGEGNRVKICEVLKLDTESFAVSQANQKVETESQGGAATMGNPANKILKMPEPGAHDRSRRARNRKHA